MRIGILLPTILASNKYSKDRIFAPKYPAVDLANGLVEKGHEVFLYTSDDVETKAKVVFGDERIVDKDLRYFQFRYRSEEERKYSENEIIKRDFEYYLTLKAYKDAQDGKLDIIHSYHDFGAHYFNDLTKFPTVYTLHDPLPQTDDTIEFLRYDKFKHHNYISISNKQRESILDLNFIDTIYHGIRIDEYDLNLHPENKYIYFGRVIADKGPDLALQISRDMGVHMDIATTNSEYNTDKGYFAEQIQPYIDEGSARLVGYMQGKEKSKFIGSGKAYILPLRWDEPFGLTIIESMACGTPVVAFSKGSVPELVVDGKTGFVVDPNEGVDGITEALKKIPQIDRNECRRHVENNFTVNHMVDNYINAYNKVLNK